MKLNELLGTEFPIIQGGMANIATAEFAAACSNAGALGVIAAGGLRTGEALREEIRESFARNGVTMTYNHLNVHLMRD